MQQDIGRRSHVNWVSPNHLILTYSLQVGDAPVLVKLALFRNKEEQTVIIEGGVFRDLL